jgi:hypothetical protein
MLGPRIGPKIGPRFGPAIGVTADEIAAAASGGDPAIAPRDPINGAQFLAMLGAPASSEAYLNCLYVCNDEQSPIGPVVGAFPIATAAGAPVFGSDGPSTPLGDTYSKSVTLTDGQAAQLSSSSATPFVIGTLDYAFFTVQRFGVGAPAGNRIVWGWNSAEDGFLQLRTNGSIYHVSVDGGVTTTIQLNIPHNTGQWTAVSSAIAGGNARVSSNLGTGSPVALAPDVVAATLQIGQNGNCPAMDFHLGAVFISDGTPAGDAAIQDLYDNGEAYCDNLLAALVNP